MSTNFTNKRTGNILWVLIFPYQHIQGIYFMSLFTHIDD